MKTTDPLFTSHKLNSQGQTKAIDIAQAFDELLSTLRDLCPENTREFSITKTKLEEACFYAKKSMAMKEDNQEK